MLLGSGGAGGGSGSFDVHVDALLTASGQVATDAASYTSDDTDASSSFSATFTSVAGLGSTASSGISAP